jgi:hypothetical protein
MKFRTFFTGIALFFVLFSGAKATPSQSRAEESLLCGTAVGYRFLDEVQIPGKPDKFKHCSLSCVITQYCGPVEGTLIGALKEVYDALGFGDPDIEDMKADLAGVKAGVKLGPLSARADCYKFCSALFP